MSAVDQPELEVARTTAGLRQFMDDFTKQLDVLVEGVAMDARDSIAEFLSIYRQVIPLIDSRLLHCTDLLGKGLRDEALGYEADEPALLESATLLDLASKPQWPAWRRALADKRFPLPAPPRMDLAAGLFEAQNALAALKPDLDRWRRLNLANAPLPHRIRILRLLREKDSNNAAWFEALAEHERQRFMEIERDIKAATAARDERALAALSAELATPWMEPVPARLVAAATAALDGFKSGRIDRQLDDAARALLSAHEARDIEAGRDLRGRWQSLCEEKGAFSAGDPRLGDVEPVMVWLGWHDRLESLFAEIWQSLDAKPEGLRSRRDWVRSLSRMGDELEDLAEKLHDEIDMEPIERAQQRIARAADLQRRDDVFRQRAVLLSVASFAAVLAGVVYGYARATARDRDVVLAVKSLEDEKARITVGAFRGLPEYSWAPHVAADPRVQALQRTNRAEAERQEERRRQLKARLDEITAGVDAIGKASWEPFANWPPEFAAATKALAAIDGRGDAVTEEENADVIRARGRIDLQKSRFINACDAKVRERIRDLGALLDGLTENTECNLPAVAAGLEKVRIELSALRESCRHEASPGAEGAYAGLKVVSAEAAALVGDTGALAKQAKELETQIAQSRRLAKMETELDGVLGNWPQYEAKLKVLATESGGRVVARDYRDAAESVDAWAAVGEWSEFVEKHVRPMDAVSAAEAQTFVQAVEKLSPQAKQLSWAENFLETIRPAVESLDRNQKKTFIDEITTFTTGPWMNELVWVVRTDDEPEKYFYCLAQPQPFVDDKDFKYVLAMRPVDGNWPQKSIRGPVTAVEKAPHVVLGEQIREMLAKRGGVQGLAFEQVMIDVVNAIVAARKVDPIVRVVVLRKVIKAASETSRLFRDQDLTSIVDDGDGGIPGFEDVDARRFVPPERRTDPQYARLRDFTCPGIVKKCVETLASVEQSLAVEAKVLRNPTTARLEPVGRLSRDCRGALVAVLKDMTTSPTGPLWCVDARGSIEQVGQIDSKGAFKATPNAKAPAGSPLFTKVDFKPAVRAESGTAGSAAPKPAGSKP